jgi:prepilin-type N-terminal cleavage/methylation domain-containing protein
MRQTAFGKQDAARRGFTLIEMMIVLLVIFMLMGLLIGGIHLVHGSVRATADRATVQSLKNGATQFKQIFNFYPPLVNDMATPAPVNPTTNKPVVYSDGADVVFLRTNPGAATADMRFSVYSPAYYLLGALEAPVDGVAGPGMRAVKRDGSFETAGKIFQPFYDVSRKSNAVYRFNNDVVRPMLRDRNEVAFRLYHWLPGQPTGPNAGQVLTPADLNVPAIVGDPTTDERLRTVTWAIVAAGPDGVFGNEEQIFAVAPNHPQAMDPLLVRQKLGLPANATFSDVWNKASKDNIVELLP